MKTGVPVKIPTVHVPYESTEHPSRWKPMKITVICFNFQEIINRAEYFKKWDISLGITMGYLLNDTGFDYR
jgi:hypothetical protein